MFESNFVQNLRQIYWGEAGGFKYRFGGFSVEFFNNAEMPYADFYHKSLIFNIFPSVQIKLVFGKEG